MKRCAVVLLALLAVPSTAAAAPLSELPFAALPDRDAAGCLRPTGVPGGLALFGRPGSSDLWRADAGGLVRGERARLGRHLQCAAVVEAGGAAVAAAVVGSDRRYAVRAVARDPGGAYGAPVAVSTGPQPRDVSAAIAPNGHAVVA